MEGAGLNVTVMSYLDSLDIGFMVCDDLVPDVWDLADAVRPAFDELRRAALGPDAAADLSTATSDDPSGAVPAAARLMAMAFNIADMFEFAVDAVPDKIALVAGRPPTDLPRARGAGEPPRPPPRRRRHRRRATTSAIYGPELHRVGRGA